MKVYPAVDILEGRCVQLVQGRKESATVFGHPLDCAHRWLQEGAEALHIVNLDGAFGQAEKNAAVIRELIVDTGVVIQLGGGIRSFGDAESWLDKHGIPPGVVPACGLVYAYSLMSNIRCGHIGIVHPLIRVYAAAWLWLARHDHHTIAEEDH